MNLELCTSSWVTSKLHACTSSMLKVHSIDLSSNVGAFGSPKFFLLEMVFGREMMKSHSVWELVIQLNFPFLHVAFIIRRNVNSNDAEYVLSSSSFAVCLYAHFCIFGNANDCCIVLSFSVVHVGGVVAQTKSTVTSAGPTDWVRHPQPGCLER